MYAAKDLPARPDWQPTRWRPRDSSATGGRASHMADATPRRYDLVRHVPSSLKDLCQPCRMMSI